MTLSEKLKKLITKISIVCVIAAGLIAILYLVNCNTKFIEDSLNATLVKVLLTLLVVFLSGLFLLNAVDAISSKNVFGLISAGLIGACAVLFFISIWGGIEGAFLNATVIIAAITIMFNTIVGNYLSIGKKALVLQIISYIALAIFEGLIVYAIIGNDEDFFMNTWLIMAIDFIVWGVCAIILLFRKKAILSDAKNIESDGDKVVLTKAEYDALLAKIANLEEQLKN